MLQGYQQAAKAAAMLRADDRALKFLQLGTARCPESEILANVFEKFKQQQEANKNDRTKKLESTFETEKVSLC